MAAAPTATAAPAANGTDQAPAAPQAASVVPFVRGSGKGKYKFFSKSGLALTSASQDLGPIDIKAYDYMRSILVTVATTAAGGATGTGDAASSSRMKVWLRKHGTRTRSTFRSSKRFIMS